MNSTPMTLEQTLQTAITHHKAGELEDAEQLYRAILTEEPKHPDANHNLGVLLKQGDKANVALPFFKTALESNPNQGQFWISYIDTLIHLGQLDSARNVFEQGQSRGLRGKTADQLSVLINSVKDNQCHPLQAKIDSVNVLYSNGQIQEALDATEVLIKDYPKEASFYNISGICSRMLGKHEAAVQSFEQALVIKPDYAEVHYNLGNALKDLGQLDAAVKSYERALAIKSDGAEAHNNLGITLQELGQLNTAVKSFEQALAINSDFAEAHYNLGNTLKELGQLEAAVKSYEQALTIKPDYAKAHNNLGNALKALGQLDASVKSYERALAIKPDFGDAHNNLGVIFDELGQLGASVKSYEQALTIKPDFSDAHNNLGVIFDELGQLEAAVKSYEQALVIKPNFAEAYSNLGNTLKALGQLDASAKSYEQALAIEPDLVEVWRNIYFIAVPLIFLETEKGVWLNSLKKKLSLEVLNGPDFTLLNYRLNALNPHMAENSFNNAINTLPAIVDEVIINPKQPHSLDYPVPNPEKLIALIHFGRSGTGLFHSLIDGHSEISTLPSIYFSEYFNATVWNQLIAQGWAHLPERFVEQFSVLFDARSSMPVWSSDKSIVDLGKKEGMANVGEGRDEVLVVDKEVFCYELRELMSGYAKLNPKSFFDLVHVAYEATLKNNVDKHTLFYHIHNPSPYAKLNFLRYNPNARLLMMVREPIQSCESWVNKDFDPKEKDHVHNHILTMLFDFDQIAFRRQDSIGVRLEDLKKHPKETMVALCDWMGIEEESSLYEMTAQGKKWWGDPTSPDYGKEAMSPFGDSAIKRSVGSYFSEYDQFILRTLFYPFSVRFGYVEENFEQFNNDLQTIKPLLDKPFDFEKKLAQLSDMSIETFLKSGSSLYFRAGLHARWEVLEEFHDYPYMLKPLIILEKT
jgi:tetratricopeptide (TPR) repeat protein